MRILLGYTDSGLHAETEACMREIADVEWVDVSGSATAYWEALRDRWTGEEDLVVFEQDMIIHEHVLPQFTECPGDWCTFAYPIFNSGQRLTQGLGCTKFSAALQRRVPASGFETDAKLKFTGEDGLSYTGIPWQFLDVTIANRLKLGHGLQPHVHVPDVIHLHDYSGPVLMGGGPTVGDPPGPEAFSPYHQEVPVVFDPRPQRPAVQVYGAEISQVNSLDDAARLANALTLRYRNPDGTPRDLPAQVDTSRPQALRFVTDKVEQGYLPSYLKIAAEIGTAGRVCEVGVWQGDSLRMWQALFPGGIVAGVDNNPEARWPEQAVIIESGQDDPALPDRLAAISPGGWDLIIDDGGHDGYLTRKTWELLWPLVVPGGIYVVEDWFVGLPQQSHRGYGPSMLNTVSSFLLLLGEQDGELESVEYRYGMAILRKRFSC